jgi:chromosomal replication initiator protein
LIDGVLQLDFPANSTASIAAAGSSPFVVGAENSLVAPPVQRLLDADVDFSDAATQFNPLVLVSRAGGGKSHIAQGLVRTWSARLGSEAVAYFTAADFGRELQAARDEERLLEWQKTIRSLRLLVIEDIDRLRPRSTIQRQLRQTIDSLVAARGIVVVTAVCEPTACTQLDPGLRDRLTAGLTVRLRRPELAARRAILAQAAAARGLALDESQVEQLAQKECSTPAQLLGRLSTFDRSGSLALEGMGAPSSGDPKSPELRSDRSRSDREGVEAGTRSLHPSPNPSPSRGGEQRNSVAPTLKQILALTARYFGLTQAALTSPVRRTSLVEARNAFVHLARRHTSASFAEIGRTLGNRDHTTIMHADRRLAERLAGDPALQQAIDELDRLVGG